MGDQNTVLRQIYDSIDEASNAQLNIAECFVEKVRRSDKKVKLKMLPDLEDLGWVRVYMLGFGATFHSGTLPDVDSTVIVLFPRGQKHSAICLSGGMAEADETGGSLVGDGDILLSDRYGNKIHMQNGKIKIDGSQVIVNGGNLPVARQTDTIASPFGTLYITTGNNDFLA